MSIWPIVYVELWVFMTEICDFPSRDKMSLQNQEYFWKISGYIAWHKNTKTNLKKFLVITYLCRSCEKHVSPILFIFRILLAWRLQRDELTFFILVDTFQKNMILQLEIHAVNYCSQYLLIWEISKAEFYKWLLQTVGKGQYWPTETGCKGDDNSEANSANLLVLTRFILWSYPSEINRITGTVMC